MIDAEFEERSAEWLNLMEYRETPEAERRRAVEEKWRRSAIVPARNAPEAPRRLIQSSLIADSANLTASSNAPNTIMTTP